MTFRRIYFWILGAGILLCCLTIWVAGMIFFNPINCVFLHFLEWRWSNCNSVSITTDERRRSFNKLLQSWFWSVEFLFPSLSFINCRSTRRASLTIWFLTVFWRSISLFLDHFVIFHPLRLFHFTTVYAFMSFTIWFTTISLLTRLYSFNKMLAILVDYILLLLHFSLFQRIQFLDHML